MVGPLAGWLCDITGSYDVTFYVTGLCIFVSGAIVIPVSSGAGNGSSLRGWLQRNKQRVANGPLAGQSICMPKAEPLIDFLFLCSSTGKHANDVLRPPLMRLGSGSLDEKSSTKGQQPAAVPLLARDVQTIAASSA